MTQTDTTPAPPTIGVPDDPKMATEPAREVGKVFANRALIQPVIAAVLGVISLTFNIALDNALVDQLTTIVTFIAFIWAAYMPQREKATHALDQAEATRDVVFSPESVLDATSRAAAAGSADVISTKVKVE